MASSLEETWLKQQHLDQYDYSVNIVNNFNKQLEELDDAEFNLPPVAEVPSLESILKEEDGGGEFDGDSASEEEENVDNSYLKVEFPNGSIDTVSVNSRCSSGSHNIAQERLHVLQNREHSTKVHKSILRHVILKGVSSQLHTAYEKVGAGMPTTMAVGNFVCIGTSHGFILVFDPSQTLKWCLGSSQLGDQYGSISALALSQDSNRLLAGFAKGQICVFDVISGKLLRVIAECHTPFTAVLHIKWTDYPNLVILSDSGGSVFELSVKKTMGLSSNESQCIFSGSRGEVCVIEPLLMSQLRYSHLMEIVVIAMATISKVIVVTLRPKLRVLFSYPLRASSTTLPLLAWQFVVIQLPGNVKVIDPVLSFARENAVYFFQKMKVSYTIQNITWLNSRTIALLDFKEILHVIDVKTHQSVEAVDLSNLGLVYASPHFKAIATGGNVSEAMIVAIRTWAERIENLLKGKFYQDALQLCLDIIHDKGIAIVGLAHRKEKRVQIVTDRIKEILILYLSYAFSENFDACNSDSLHEHYLSIVPYCIKVTIEAQLKDLLYGAVWDACSVDSVARGIYLESLEDYILDDCIPDLPPATTQCLLAHYESLKKFSVLESCIVHFHVTSLDIHQAITLCWMYSLYDAIIYIYTKGINDYLTPLDELLTILKNALKTGENLTDHQITLGNKILVYISCSLAGRAYPHGDIDPENVVRVKHEILKFLTSLHSKDSSSDERPYPFLRTLLQFNTKEFLNVLAIAFQEPEFASELGMMQRHRIIDIILEVMSDVDAFSEIQRSFLYIFIARQATEPRGAMNIDGNILEKVVTALTTTKAEEYKEECQFAILELLQNDQLNNFNLKELLKVAEASGLYKVCEFLYEKNGEFVKIINCYLNDDYRKNEIFSYISVLLSANVENDIACQIKEHLVNNIKLYLDVDCNKLVDLLLTQSQLYCIISECSKVLREYQDYQYIFLDALFLFRRSCAVVSEEILREVLPVELHEGYLSLMCLLHIQNVCSYLKSTDDYRIEEVIKICTKYKCNDAESYLLERMGDVKGAFDISLLLLEECVEKLLLRNDSTPLSDEDKNCIHDKISDNLRLCNLGSSFMDENKQKELWFPFLDSLLKLQVKLLSHPFAFDIRSTVTNVLNEMMVHISVPAVLERVVQSPTYCDGNISQIKYLLKGIANRCAYNETLFKTTTNIICGDQLKYLSLQRKYSSSPIVISSSFCAVCCKPLQSFSKIVLFSCSHAYHSACGNGRKCEICSRDASDEGISLISDSHDTVNSDVLLSDMQLTGLKHVGQLELSGSRLQLLEELKTSKASKSCKNQAQLFADTVLDTSTEFSLHLAPPSCNTNS